MPLGNTRPPPPPPDADLQMIVPPPPPPTDNSPVSGTADPRSSQTGQVIRGLR